LDLQRFFHSKDVGECASFFPTNLLTKVSTAFLSCKAPDSGLGVRASGSVGIIVIIPAY
jgi:hypothetical protein